MCVFYLKVKAFQYTCFGNICRVTDHENTNKSDHCTISLKGVTRMRDDDETEFVPLDRWEQEFKYFQKLIKVSG